LKDLIETFQLQYFIIDRNVTH